MYRLKWFAWVIAIAGCGRCCDDPTSATKAKVAVAPCCEIDRSQVVALLADEKAPAGDWPLFGGTPQRNMVNLTDKNIPTSWSVEEGKQKNVKWQATVGTSCYGGPVVADGKVFVGTNNGNPRDPKVPGKRAVVMAFAEADGKFLWQIAHDYPNEGVADDAVAGGLYSTPVVDGQHLYYVTPGCEVVCASTAGKVVWQFDMMKELKVLPNHCAACSPLVAGELVFIITGNGAEQGKVLSPKAPSFAAFNKNTGKLAWQSNLPGEKILEGQWSNPTLAKVNGRDLVIFPGGDAFLYGFEAASGKLVWKFDCQPNRPEGDDPGPLNYLVSTAVVHDGKAYIGLGVAPDSQAQPFSHILCMDVTKSGDVSPKSLNVKDAKNKNSALVWSFGGKIDPVPKKGRRVYFARTISTCAIHDGLVYISEEQGFLHCLDAKTGQRNWDYDFKAGIWGSPYYVDGKIYLGSEDGGMTVFKAGKTRQVIGTMDMGEGISGTAVVVHGVLYVTTKSKLYAIAETK